MRRKHYALFILMILIFYLQKYCYEKIDKVFLELDKCPSCYGLECDNILNGEVQLTSWSKYRLYNLVLNVKNVFYGKFGKKFYVLKKLAHTSELNEFDYKLCVAAGLGDGCNVSRAISRLVVTHHKHNLTQIIKENAQLFEHSEVTMCHASTVVPFLFEKFRRHGANVENFVTLLAVNPEPLILEAFRGLLPLPSFIGSCGRVAIEEFIGSPLTHFYSASWERRANLSLQLLRLADAMTNSRIRVYLTDPSSDNFAVDSEGILRIIDVENVILVDSEDKSLDRSVHSNEGIGCKDCFSYDSEELCQHFMTDHNYFAICKGLLSANPFTSSLPGGFLHSIPQLFLEKESKLPTMIEECAQPKRFKTRLKPAQILSSALDNLLEFSSSEDVRLRRTTLRSDT